MRRIGWLTRGLLLLSATAATASDDAYRVVGDLPVMHRGRIKPLDTLAREEVKQVHGRSTIKLKGKDAGTWGPVAALIDWSARPEFWDKQEIILIDPISFKPFKQKLLAESIRSQLTAIAAQSRTSAADRAVLEKLAKQPEFSEKDLATAIKATKLADEDRKALVASAESLGEGRKYLTPEQVQSAEIMVDGRKLSLLDWVRDAITKLPRERDPLGGEPKLPPMEDKAREVLERFGGYVALRDRNEMGRRGQDITVMPRPSNEAYLKYTAEAYKKGTQPGVDNGLNAVELDAAKALDDFLEDRQTEDKNLPGKDPSFDKEYVEWLRTKAAWVPLRVIIDADVSELAKAGFDEAKVKAFRAAYTDLLAAEAKSPNALPTSSAASLIAAARPLGESLGEYPTADVMARESHFNALAPFWWAPYAFGTALVFLLISLGISAAPKTAMATFDRTIFGIGMLAFLAGIGLEVYGFYLRVLISGWAPVTNMYETVIWVALVTAVLGLVLELIYRKKYPVVAASGVALLATGLAAGVPSLLDPNIKALTPVLRSNYWLTIHVLTEVSSYAAFALAMGLGLIGTVYYLTATYRRSIGFGELLQPLLPGIPLLAAGGLGLYAANHGMGPWWFSTMPFFLGTSIVAMAGGTLALSPISAIVGEAIHRATFREDVALDEAAIEGVERQAASLVRQSSAEANGGVATLTRPTVAEIRARNAASLPKQDARTRAMQATASKVKPLANFIYRAMQVGVLLIAAGTILGGIWADYSWGRFWGWDPKEVWALITLLVYLVPLHGRFAGLVNTFTLTAASVVCFLSVIMAWYGVNFVLGVGLHSYGFVEGGSQGSVGVTLSVVLSIVFAAFWRRRRGSMTPVAV